jgi:hypothetical protein
VKRKEFSLKRDRKERENKKKRESFGEISKQNGEKRLKQRG